jgi:hypothetical protein
MKLIRITAILAAALVGTSVSATPITWTPIGPNAPAPFVPFTGFGQPQKSTTYNQIGPTTFGSDGSRSTTTGSNSASSGGLTAVRTGNQITYSDGSKGIIIDDKLFITKPDGSEGICTLVDNKLVSCRAR